MNQATMDYLKMQYQRGDVYFASFSHTSGSEIFGTHPVVLIQNDVGNYHSGTVIGVVLTSSNKKETMPTHVILDEPDSPCDGSMAMAEQVFTIDKQRLRSYVGRLSPASMQRIDDAVRASLGLTGTEPALLCLCPRCVRAFESLPHHAVRRVDWRQQAMDTCTYCGTGRGFDYWVHDWSSLIRKPSHDF